MQRGAVAVIIALVLVAGAVAYGEYVLPDGTVSGTSHEAANVVKDDARTTVDKNLNGIVDEAEFCPTCPAPGGGAGPAGMFYGSQGQVMPGGFPVKVPAGASLTHIRVTGGCMQGGTSYTGLYGGGGQYSVSYGSLIDILIDWNARTIKGFVFSPGEGSFQSLSTPLPGGVGKWNVQNAQNRVSYAPGVSGETCLWPGWCTTVELDLQNKTITKLPVYYSGCNLFSGSIQSQ